MNRRSQYDEIVLRETDGGTRLFALRTIVLRLAVIERTGPVASNPLVSMEGQAGSSGPGACSVSEMAVSTAEIGS